VQFRFCLTYQWMQVLHDVKKRCNFVLHYDGEVHPDAQRLDYLCRPPDKGPVPLGGINRLRPLAPVYECMVRYNKCESFLNTKPVGWQGPSPILFKLRHRSLPSTLLSPLRSHMSARVPNTSTRTVILYPTASPGAGTY